jgi:hypothetical protein
MKKAPQKGGLKGAVDGTRTHILPLTRRVLFDRGRSLQFSYHRNKERVPGVRLARTLSGHKSAVLLVKLTWLNPLI